MSNPQQRRLWRRQAASIKQLGPCSTDTGQLKAGWSSLSPSPLQTGFAEQPAWDFQPVHLSGDKRNKQAADVHTGGRLGQAVLHLPLGCADVSLQLPPGLQLTATPAGGLDCRLQLLGMTADWPVCRQQNDAGGYPMPRLLPARSPTAGFACRTGALLLAHALFPDHTHGLLGWLAVPVAVADGLAVVGTAAPASTRQAVADKAVRVKEHLQGRGARIKKQRRGRGNRSDLYWDGGGAAAAGVGWLDGTGGVAAGAMHVLRCLSGPAAALASAGWLWSVLHPISHTLCSCMVALMAVAADYSQLGKDISRGRVGSGKELEAAWHARHKAAAQRLAGYCGDLPHTPPLQPLLRIAGCCSIAAGLAVDGQALSGLLPAAHTAAGLAGQHADAAGGLHGGVQLLMSGSIHAPADRQGHSNKHEAAGLSRTQLLELFTGSAVAGDSSGTCSSSVAAACGDSGPVPAGGCCVGAHAPASSGAAGGYSSAACVAAAVHGANRGMDVDSMAAAVPEAALDGFRAEQQQQQLAVGTRRASGTVSSQACCVSDAEDPLAFLNDLPLYGQQDHVTSTAPALVAGVRHVEIADALQLSLRGVYLLIVFAPFLLLGVPMLLVAWYLLTRAAAAALEQEQLLSAGAGLSPAKKQVAAGGRHQHSRRPVQHANEEAAVAGGAPGMDIVAAVSPETSPGSTFGSGGISPCGATPDWPAGLTVRLQQVSGQILKHAGVLLGQLAKQLQLLLCRLAAFLDLLLVLLLGGHWQTGMSAWESGGLFLRRRAWQLLLFSCSSAGAAFIKWGQWSSSRRDIFPEDFCDTLSALHDRAPVHSFRHSRRLVEAAFGVKLGELFETFDPKPLASGSIAQVHRATLRRGPRSSSRLVHGQECECDAEPQLQEVVVKVCHPNVSHHIRLDFRLLSGLSAAASRLPALRGLSIRESVSQFSHTMTAQTDLRVEATHALRFHNNFSGVASSVSIPHPVSGLVSELVLVESYEAGRGVAVFMKEPSPINTQIVALGVDAFLKMLLVDNFVHTDLHPGNILFRAVPTQHGRQRHKQLQQEKEQEQQQQRRQAEPWTGDGRSCPWWQFWRRSGSRGGAAAASSSPTQPAAPEQWELELQQMVAQQQQRWVNKHAATSSSSAAALAARANAAAAAAAQSDEARSLEQQLLDGCGHDAGVAAQLVLLDFGLAEQLTPEVRHHFISFLNSIAAGDGLMAARHLLCWSHNQSCPDTRAFTADVRDLFEQKCDIQSEAGIDLDAVMKSVLGLARKHSVSIDSSYASLVISVCVLVGFAQSLDPEVNLMDAATPTLLAYSMTGKVVGRLYS